MKHHRNFIENRCNYLQHDEKEKQCTPYDTTSYVTKSYPKTVITSHQTNAWNDIYQILVLDGDKHNELNVFL